MALEQLLAADRKKILEIAHRHGVTRIRVFGSFVRNEARADSDLDLLIEAGAQTSRFFPGGLIADLEEALGRKVDVVEDGGLHHLLRDRIRAEAVGL